MINIDVLVHLVQFEMVKKNCQLKNQNWNQTATALNQVSSQTLYPMLLFLWASPTIDRNKNLASHFLACVSNCYSMARVTILLLGAIIQWSGSLSDLSLVTSSTVDHCFSVRTQNNHTVYFNSYLGSHIYRYEISKINKIHIWHKQNKTQYL